MRLVATVRDLVAEGGLCLELREYLRLDECYLTSQEEGFFDKERNVVVGHVHLAISVQYLFSPYLGVI